MRKKKRKSKTKSANCWGNSGISGWINDIEMKQVFEDRPHERRQVILKVQGHEFKGFVHEGEVPPFGFISHPKQKLKDEHVEAIETEIYEKGADTFLKGVASGIDSLPS